MARALTTNATVTIKNPSGQAVVNSQQMTCTALGSGTFSGSAFDSPTLCGFNTTSANLINRTNTSCAYTYTKNYSAEGAWTANVTFYHTAYENRGVNIDTTNGTVDTQSPPTGQATLDCTANTTCVSDPQCNNTLNESVNMTIYAINWDTTQADCVGYGKLWYPGKTSGSNYYCCGDDGTSDDFAYWSGTTCMYCNNGVNSSTTTKCSATSAYCTGVIALPVRVAMTTIAATMLGALQLGRRVLRQTWLVAIAHAQMTYATGVTVTMLLGVERAATTRFLVPPLAG